MGSVTHFNSETATFHFHKILLLSLPSATIGTWQKHKLQRWRAKAPEFNNFIPLPPAMVT